MRAKRNFTTSIKTSREFVRRSKSGGLELVKVGKNGKETVKPVCVASRIEKGGQRERIVIGYEPRFLNSILEVF